MTQTAHVAARKPPSCILPEADHLDGKAPHRPANPWPCAARRAARGPAPATVYRAARFIAGLLMPYHLLRWSARHALKNFAGVCCAGIPVLPRNGQSEATFAGHVTSYPRLSRARSRALGCADVCGCVRTCADLRGLERTPRTSSANAVSVRAPRPRPGSGHDEGRSQGRCMVVSVYLSRAIARCGVRRVRIRSVHAGFQLRTTVNPDGSNTVRIQAARRKVTHPAETRCPTPCRTSAGPSEHRRAPECRRAAGFRRVRAPTRREAGCAARPGRARIA